MWIRNLAKYGLIAAHLALIGSFLAMPYKTAVAFERVSVTSKRVLSDPATGLALGGYDPVAYFVDGAARQGKAEFELYTQGTVWRFVNEGNREAFRHSPGVYAPQFGGYGALSVSRGYPAEASPLVWTIFEGRLYLFASPVNRQAWLLAAQNLAEKGRKSWPAIESRLAR